jgi:hypothetical protein
VFPKVAEILLLLAAGMDHDINFDEIVEAVGASVAHLAALVLKQITRVTASPTCVVWPGNSYVVALDFSWTPAPSLSRRPFACMHIVPALVTAILAFHGTPAGRSVVETCFIYLAKALLKPPGYTYAAQSLATDVLRAILVVGGSITTRALQSRTDDRLGSTLTELLTEILPRALVHYEVVVTLKQAFAEATAVAPTSGISTSPFAKAWQHFSWLANTRLEFLQSWEERLKVSFKGCDNMLVGFPY